jgi:dolichol-phosphate mannosyltransferase
MKSPGGRFGRSSAVGRFSVVGMLGAGLQLWLQSLLTQSLGFPSVTATPVAVEITILHNFLWHERFTWRHRTVLEKPRATGPQQIARRLWRFHAANGLISLGGNTILMYWLVERLKAPAAPAAVGAILLCSVANFLVADRWVYVPRS